VGRVGKFEVVDVSAGLRERVQEHCQSAVVQFVFARSKSAGELRLGYWMGAQRGQRPGRRWTAVCLRVFFFFPWCRLECRIRAIMKLRLSMAR
jgi:hypothetical protein